MIGNSIYQLLLLSIYSARREIIMTTPYFVPDEAVSTALLTAAERARLCTGSKQKKRKDAKRRSGRPSKATRERG